ncbi:MAG: DUF1343 domain-containing protein [Candidatus Riflebacteria bacterium]|nr:DUF1343 domain-containing protein [Candidatus Riflebacteria bacterium]
MKFEPGIESFFAANHPRGRSRVAVVTNFTGRDRHGVHLVRRLAEDSRFELKRIFTPEHGFDSDAPDGEHVADSSHSELKVEIVSLYGTMKKPAPEYLRDLDMLIYDIQDVGVRFYTYISTLRNVMESADEAGVNFAVLDRPDVLGGVIVEGPMLEPQLKSFVGHLPVALRYGLTPGELALWWKKEAGLQIEVKVYECQHYRCPTAFSGLGFPWFKPSPSMPDTATAAFYPGTCLFEGTELAEGRGTSDPFRNLGAPWVDGQAWANCLKPLLPENILVKATSFTPEFGKCAGEQCNGINLNSLTSNIDNAVYVGVAALYALMQTHPGQVSFAGRPGLSEPFIDYLAGTSLIRKGLLVGEKPSDILTNACGGTDLFREKRKEFFLYPRG